MSARPRTSRGYTRLHQMMKPDNIHFMDLHSDPSRQRFKLGPVVLPVVRTQLLARHRMAAFPLNRHSEIGRTRPHAVHHVLQMTPAGGAA